MKYRFLILLLLPLLFSCNKNNDIPYEVSGRVTDPFGVGIANMEVTLNRATTVFTDDQGYWNFSDLTGSNTIAPVSPNLTFTPEKLIVNNFARELNFTGFHNPGIYEQRVYNWMKNQQLSNGLLESAENGNVVSLYDNALAAMVFLLNNDVAAAENIFDFFNARIASELQDGPGGFSQFRDASGIPGGHRWMGDNAWLLIALNNHKDMTGSSKYDALSVAISNWLVGLQDTDGGLFAGYGVDNLILNYKVTEGMIDAYNAVEGYGNFHSSLLQYLENDRWDAMDPSLKAWPTNPAYQYALDCHSWSYCIFNDYPVATLYASDRFLTTKTATVTGQTVNGYDIDVDRDVVFLEGTGQMAVAFHQAGLPSQTDYYLSEMEKAMFQSTATANAYGFPYATNPGTGYGTTPLWLTADTEIALSGGAWYVFAKYGFNPFAVGHKTTVPVADQFWLN